MRVVETSSEAVVNMEKGVSFYMQSKHRENLTVHGFGEQNNSYQQQNTNNPFGFRFKAASVSASHQQQQKPNPFGFASQNSSYSNAPSHSDFKPNQFKNLSNNVRLMVDIHRRRPPHHHPTSFGCQNFIYNVSIMKAEKLFQKKGHPTILTQDAS